MTTPSPHDSAATQQPLRISLVVFDWAGTTVDHGCFAPVQPFVEALAQADLVVTQSEARGPMGLGKRDHLRALLSIPRIAESWRRRHGRAWSEIDVDRMYKEEFMPRQLASVVKHSRLIPGLLETVAWLRSREIKIGTSTGYFREAAEITYREAAAQGYVPDHNVTPGDVAEGRPAPWMIFRNMEALGVYPPAAVVKVGDTVPDIQEGLAAGVWSVGVARTGSDVGLMAEDFAALSADEQRARVETARQRLRSAGAHTVIDSVADLIDFLPSLDARVAAGERP